MYRNYPENLGAWARFGGPVPPWPQPRTATARFRAKIHHKISIIIFQNLVALFHGSQCRPAHIGIQKLLTHTSHNVQHCPWTWGSCIRWWECWNSTGSELQIHRPCIVYLHRYTALQTFTASLCRSITKLLYITSNVRTTVQLTKPGCALME